MRKLQMQKVNELTFGEVCEGYLENCRQRNLRQGTINHYRQSYLAFNKFFNKDMPITDIDEKAYKNYVLYYKYKLELKTA